MISGSAQDLHDAESDFSRRLIRVNEVSGAALVLGSTQSPSLIDPDRAAAAGIEVASRRSGGGVVSLQPGAQCWIDVFLPADDPLWVDDVMDSVRWLGSSWAKVAKEFGWGGAVVHEGPISNRELSRLVCFAALGAGEVHSGPTKLVGISQRRTRHGARFQCVTYLQWDPSPILELVDLGELAVGVRNQLLGGVAALGGDESNSRWSVVECLLHHLP